MATKLHGQTDQRLARVPEVQRLRLAESDKAVSGQDPGRISVQLGKPMLQTGSGTSAAEADFLSSLAAGINALLHSVSGQGKFGACSTPCRDKANLVPAPPPVRTQQIWCLLHSVLGQGKL